jgi:hypothetical protein
MHSVPPAMPLRSVIVFFFSSDRSVIVECLLNKLRIFFLCSLYCQSGAGKDKPKESKGDKASTKADV